MCVRVANLNDSADKFERRAGQAGQDYESGVSSVSDSEQQQATLDAADNWEQGVQDAISEGRFSSGVNNPNKSWQTAALETGSTRFTQGASNAGDTWTSGFQDFADTLESLSLQPRGARGSEANFQRSRAVGEALHNERQG
jgi:hypothetical protein